MPKTDRATAPGSGTAGWYVAKTTLARIIHEGRNKSASESV
jgi:hypothetical protein